MHGLWTVRGPLIHKEQRLLLRLVCDAQHLAGYELERLDALVPQAVVRNNDNVLLPKHLAVSGQHWAQVDPHIVLYFFSKSSSKYVVLKAVVIVFIHIRLW